MPIQSSCSEGLRYGRTSRSRFDSFFERIYETGSKKFPRQCSPEVFLRPGSSSPQHVSFFDPLPGLVLRMICALGNPIFLIQHMMPNKYLLANMLVRYYGCGFYLHKHSYSLFCRCVSTYCLFFLPIFSSHLFLIFVLAPVTLVPKKIILPHYLFY
jgi:hypothetical protein